MRTRICLVALTPSLDPQLSGMLEVVAASHRGVLAEGTTVEARAPRLGPAEGSRDDFLYYFRNPFVELHVKTQVAEAFVAAEREGFDAAVVNCFDDTGVREARGLVDMPVFGLGEPSLHLACQLGDKLGAIVPDSPGQVAYAKAQLEAHGIASRLIDDGIRADSCPLAEAMPRGIRDAKEMAERLGEIGGGLVRDGADVVVVACGGLGMICGLAGLHSLEVDGRRVPVVLPHTAALKQAESFVALRRGVDLPLPGRQVHGGMRLGEDDAEFLRKSYDL